MNKKHQKSLTFAEVMNCDSEIFSLYGQRIYNLELWMQREF